MGIPFFFRLTRFIARSLDSSLQTREGPARTFLILGRYAARTVFAEQREMITGSLLWPSNWLPFIRAWVAYGRVELKLSVYESWLYARRIIGMKPVIAMSSVSM
jgi:hypothetical protein